MCYFVSLLVAFFTRKIFLDQLGTEFIGLTGTLQSLLGFLNLAELGIGTAIGYVLYKPISENDYSKINEVISVFGYLYHCIGLFIIGAGIVLSFFLPCIFPNTSFSYGIIYFGFYSYLMASILGYFVNYKQTLLSADQRNYIVTGYFQVATTTKVLVQMVLALTICSFYLYLAMELVFGIINSIILQWKINAIYPWLQSEVKLGQQLFKKYPEIGKYVKQLFIHKIATFVQFQITPFLIYSYVSLPIVALYGNYMMLTQKVQGFVSGILDSTGAGIGNLILEGDSRKIYDTYKELFAVRFLLVGVLSACIFFLGTSFISMWLGDKYLLSDLVVLLIVVQFFMSIMRGTTDQFLFGYGLFYDVWAPAVETVVFMLSAMLCGRLWGLAGVLCGPIISLLLIVHIWKPYFLFIKGFRLPFTQYVVLLFKHLVPVIASYYFSAKLCNYIIDTALSGWSNWLLKASYFMILMFMSAFISIYLISSGLRSFIQRLKKKYHE